MDDILKFLDAEKRKAGRKRRFSPEVAKARVKEQKGRDASARWAASSALAKAFPDEFRALYAVALRRVNEKRGPLPGDSE